MSEYITIGDCAVIFQGRNLDKAKLNTEGKGIPYIVGACCMKDARLKCEKYCENFENETISKLGDILVSTVGPLGCSLCSGNIARIRSAVPLGVAGIVHTA